MKHSVRAMIRSGSASAESPPRLIQNQCDRTQNGVGLSEIDPIGSVVTHQARSRQALHDQYVRLIGMSCNHDIAIDRRCVRMEQNEPARFKRWQHRVPTNQNTPTPTKGPSPQFGADANKRLLTH